MTEWHWKVRIYAPNYHYYICQLTTPADDIMSIIIHQRFYERLTGCRMLAEGMQEKAYADVEGINTAFKSLWESYFVELNNP